MPHFHGKRYRAALDVGGFDRQKRYGLDEALQLLQKFPAAKFDETVGLSIRLGIDPKKSDQLIRGSISLPKGIGKQRVVAVFAEGDAAKEALENGADFVGGEDLAKKITDGWTDFEICIAHPAMMRHVGRLGKVLGPQGKMPSPKTGTVTDKIGQTVKEYKAGKVEFRTDAGGNVHVVVGKRSFKMEELHANIAHFLEHIKSIRPASVKGTYVRKVCIASTMSPGIVLDVVA